jgi:hypothetical protein
MDIVALRRGFRTACRRIRAGATFYWSTGGLEINSTLREVDPLNRTVWGGPAQGITGVHVWTFTPNREQVKVVTEESWSGEPVEADSAAAHSMLDGAITVSGTSSARRNASVGSALDAVCVRIVSKFLGVIRDGVVGNTFVPVGPVGVDVILTRHLKSRYLSKVFAPQRSG